MIIITNSSVVNFLQNNVVSTVCRLFKQQNFFVMLLLIFTFIKSVANKFSMLNALCKI